MPTAVVIAPGRGSYGAAELGYLARHHGGRGALLAGFDAIRSEAGQAPLTALDGASEYAAARHAAGENAAALIHACAYADYLSIDRQGIEILAVTGNSMGWYTALACAGALSAEDGFALANSMGRITSEHGTGGQLIYPCTGPDWRDEPARRSEILARVADIDGRKGHALWLSIDLGGYLVLAGDRAGLKAFEAEMPRIDDRYPLRLARHAAFHTPLMAAAADKGRARFPAGRFRAPQLPMIDGRGAIWWPKAYENTDLHAYTLGHQVVTPFDFAALIRVAAREFMPDMFILLGPGAALGGAVAQSLVRARWRGMETRADFEALQARAPVLAAMGRADQRAWVARAQNP